MSTDELIYIAAYPMSSDDMVHLNQVVCDGKVDCGQYVGHVAETELPELRRRRIPFHALQTEPVV